MSGGHFDYQYQRVDALADDIEREFINGGKYMDEDWSIPSDEVNSGPYWGKRPTVERDILWGANPMERVVILEEVRTLVADLKRCAKRAKELEWYLSGDTGVKTYLDRLKKIE